MGQNILLYFPDNFLYPGKKATPNYLKEISLGNEAVHTVYTSINAIKMWPGN